MTTQLPVHNGHDHGLAPAEEAPPSLQLIGGEVRTYRGRSLEEIIPRIREELGSDAVILRQREGLVGGVGGFFAQRCVEVDARAGGPSISVYADDSDDPDEDDELALPEPVLAAEPVVAFAPVVAPPPLAEPSAAPEPAGFAARLQSEVAAAEAFLGEAPVPPAPPAAPRIVRSDTEALIARLCGVGCSESWATLLLGQSAVHASPFLDGGGLRGAVLDTLARSLPVAPPLPYGGGAVAFVGAGGSGKTSCVVSLAAAYRRASTLPVRILAVGTRDDGRAITEQVEPLGVPVTACATPQAAARMLATERERSLVILDTAAPRQGDADAVAEFAAGLAALELDAIHLVLPATVGAVTADRLLTALQPIGAISLAVTHVDETDQIGTALELACTRRLPVAYLHEGEAGDAALSAPRPAQLAEMLL